MKKTTTLIIITISILLVGLYTVASTYSVIIEVMEKDGVTEIVNEITVRDLLINEDGTYNNTYYDLKKELELTDEEASILINSKELNNSLKTILESIVEYRVHENIDAKFSNEELYDIISSSIINTDNISDETKSRIINKASIYRDDISDYIYDIEVSMLGSTV